MSRHAMLLAGILVVALGSAVTAQSPEPPPGPPPWIGGRVEMPERGFAVTLPKEWVGFDTAGDALPQREAVSGLLDPQLWRESDTEWVDGFAETASSGFPLFAGHATKEESCRLGAWRSDETADEAAELDFEWYSDDPSSRDVEPPRAIELSTGAAYLVRLTRQVDPDSDDWWPIWVHWLAADGIVLQVYCVTDVVQPDDRWLPILESVEILPPQQPAPPPWIGGRVEMPEHGFGVTLPDDWVGFDTDGATASHVETAFDVLDPVMWSSDTATWLDGFDEQASKGVPLWVAHATSTSRCELGPSTPGVSLFDTATHHLENYTNDPDTTDVDPGLVDLPNGTAYRIHMTHRNGSYSDEWPASHYVLGPEGALIEAYCYSYDARPEDDWLSLVERIEVLPIEQ